MSYNPKRKPVIAKKPSYSKIKPKGGYSNTREDDIEIKHDIKHDIESWRHSCYIFKSAVN